MKLSDQVTGRGGIIMSLEKEAGRTGATVKIIRNHDEEIIYHGDAIGFSLFVDSLSTLRERANRFAELEVPR